MSTFGDSYRLILGEIEQALEGVDQTQIEALVDELLACEKVFVIGVGRSFLSLQAFAKRLNHLGIPAYCVGDINEPAITSRDVLLVGSGSGETVVPVAIARVAKAHGARIVHIGSNAHSSVAALTHLFVRIPVRTKLALPDEIESRQIMSSLFEQCLYLVGDGVALMIARRRNLNLAELWHHHANLE